MTASQRRAAPSGLHVHGDKSSWSGLQQPRADVVCAKGRWESWGGKHDPAQSASPRANGMKNKGCGQQACFPVGRFGLSSLCCKILVKN